MMMMMLLMMMMYVNCMACIDDVMGVLDMDLRP